MYANLRVRYSSGDGDDFEVSAWKIEREGDRLVIGLDDPEDEGNYAAPIGEVRIEPRHLISVDPDF